MYVAGGVVVCRVVDLRVPLVTGTRASVRARRETPAHAQRYVNERVAERVVLFLEQSPGGVRHVVDGGGFWPLLHVPDYSDE